jgi:hypothetical protein
LRPPEMQGSNARFHIETTQARGSETFEPDRRSDLHG